MPASGVHEYPFSVHNPLDEPAPRTRDAISEPFAAPMANSVLDEQVSTASRVHDEPPKVCISESSTADHSVVKSPTGFSVRNRSSLCRKEVGIFHGFYAFL